MSAMFDIKNAAIHAAAGEIVAWLQMKDKQTDKTAFSFIYI